jgi:hypothetical protein
MVAVRGHRTGARHRHWHRRLAGRELEAETLRDCGQQQDRLHGGEGETDAQVSLNSWSATDIASPTSGA